LKEYVEERQGTNKFLLQNCGFGHGRDVCTTTTINFSPVVAIALQGTARMSFHGVETEIG